MMKTTLICVSLGVGFLIATLQGAPTDSVTEVSTEGSDSEIEGTEVSSEDREVETEDSEIYTEDPEVDTEDSEVETEDNTTDECAEDDSKPVQPKFLCTLPVVGDSACSFACRLTNFARGSCEAFVCKCEEPIKT